MRFEKGDGFGQRTVGNKRDVEENLQQIKEARRMSDWVVVSLHCHELGGEKLLTAAHRSEIDELADFAVDFAHRSIEAGADIFVGHGPQEPFGIEIYQGRPIFHSLGTTIFELETPQFLAEEAYARYGLGGDATKADLQEGRDLVTALKLASLCGHGTGLARFAESILRYYPTEIEPCFK